MYSDLQILERVVRRVYNNLQKVNPGTHCLTLEVVTYEHSGETQFLGYYHGDKDSCVYFKDIAALNDIYVGLVAKDRAHKILFQNFKHVLR